MTRAARLLQLMQILRGHRQPVSGAALAGELGVSLRTLYRDIASLQGQGATIEGEPGLGYVLRPGFLLPPLMLTREELEALVLGSRWVAKRTDSRLAEAARQALAKVAAVLPPDLRHELDTSSLLVGSTQQPADRDAELAQIRGAIRNERKLAIDYRDAQGRSTTRTIWPFALGFFEQVRMVAAWCEQRREYRHFRADRIVAIRELDEPYPRRRHAMVKEWRQLEGIPDR